MMKKHFATFLAAAFATTSFAAFSPGNAQDAEQLRILADPGPRTVKIAKTPTVKAFAPGRNNLEIVIAPDAVRVVKFAAEELGKYLQKSLGAAIPVVNVPSAGKVSLILGDNVWNREAGLDVSKLARDGFFIKTVGGRVHIAGRDEAKGNPGQNYGWGGGGERGTMNGVYDFLERFVGVRFYFPGEIGTVVPKHSSLALPEIDIRDRPDYPRRRLGPGTIALGQKWFPEDPFDNRKVGYCSYIWRLESFYVPVCHSLERLKFMERFAKDHPEYFAVDASGNRYLNTGTSVDGNLCYSNPGFRNELYRDAVAFLTGRPAGTRGLKGWDPSPFQKGFFNIMPKDHFRDCMCAECRKFYAENPKGDLVWDLTADIARRLKKANIKGYVTCLAYGHYPNPPKNIQFPDNVLMMVSVRGPWGDNQPRTRAEHDKRIQTWQKLMGHKPWLWTAAYKYAGLELPGVPSATPLAVATYFNRQKNNISGTFMEAETDSWLQTYLNYYFMAKSCWDNNFDAKSALAEHHRLLFGAGAAPLARFFDRVERIWLDKIAGRIVETNLGSQAIAPSDYELWEKIYSPEVIASCRADFAEAAKLTASDPEAGKRVAYYRRHFLGPVEQGAAKYLATKKAVSNWSYRTRTIDHAPTAADWNAVKSGWLLPFDKKTDKAEVATSFKALADAQNLYFKVRCEEPKAGEMFLASTRRDDPEIWRDSVVEFFINPSGDRKHYFHFIVNADGNIADTRCRRVGSDSDADRAWNSRAAVKTGRETAAWTVDFTVPKSDLPGFDPARCVVNIGRHRVVKSQAAVPLYSYSPYIKGFHDLENYGTFDFTGRHSSDGLIKNHDFSAKPQGRYLSGWWSNQSDLNAGLVELDRTCFRVGGAALRVTVRDKGIKWGGTHYLPEMKPNTKYELSFFVRTENIKPTGEGYQGQGGAVVNLGVPHNLWYPKNMYQGTMPWTRQGWIFTSGAGVNVGKNKAYIRLGLLHATGTVWFDDVQLREVK